MTLLDGSDSARQPIFLQYLNPEVSRLYKFAPSLGDDNYWKSLHLTKLALFVGDHVSMPASYLIEVPFIDRLLEDLRPASEQGMVRYMSSSADLTAYAPKKSRQDQVRTEGARLKLHIAAPGEFLRIGPVQMQHGPMRRNARRLHWSLDFQRS